MEGDVSHTFHGIPKSEFQNLVGWCRLTVSKPALKAPMVPALEATI